MLYLDKILSQLVYPLGFSLALLGAAFLLLILRRHRLAGGLLCVAIGWLGLWSLPVVSDVIRLSLEGQYLARAADELPQADAIVVLGGGMQPASGGFEHGLDNSADRVWHAARLYHAGKAPLIIASGGVIEWQGNAVSEGEAMREFLVDLGVPGFAVILEEQSRNTRENAVYTAELLAERRLQRVLLVTSALHMRRAVATFRAAGVEVIPAATDYEVMPEPNHLLRWLPDSEALDGSTRALKEYLGMWVYRWRGWAE